MNQLKLWILPEEEMIHAVPLPAPTGDPDRDCILRLEAGRLVALAAQRWMVEYIEEHLPVTDMWWQQLRHNMGLD